MLYRDDSQRRAKAIRGVEMANMWPRRHRWGAGTIYHGMKIKQVLMLGKVRGTQTGLIATSLTQPTRSRLSPRQPASTAHHWHADKVTTGHLVRPYCGISERRAGRSRVTLPLPAPRWRRRSIGSLSKGATGLTFGIDVASSQRVVRNLTISVTHWLRLN